jgi:putative transposase
MRRIAAIGRLCNLSQVLGIGAIVHNAIVQGGASRIRDGPANDRKGVGSGFQFRIRGNLLSRNAIRTRIRQLDPRTRTRTRYGAKAAHSKHASAPGSFSVEHVLQSVQIDHALADVIVVDERDRLAIGRPWITLAIDVFCRGVLGFYVSLDPPSVTSIGMCLTQACLPKEPWLLARGLSHLQWPLCGLMDVLRADNGRDFRSEPLRRGCREHNIKLDFRPIAAPHFGGHIERLIGTMIGRIHLLPGTTFANPRERKGYPSEQKAAMTLSEFEHWLCVEMSERYHRDTHRGLGATPLGTWEHDMSRGIAHEIPRRPEAISDLVLADGESDPATKRASAF